MKGITEGWLRAARDDLDSSAMQLTRIKYDVPGISRNFPKGLFIHQKNLLIIKKVPKIWFNRGRLNPRRGKTMIFKIYFIEYL